MYVGRDFDPIDNNSSQVFGFNLTATLPSGSTVVAAQSGLILQSGMDDTPETHFIGSTDLVAAGRVTQMLFFGIPPNNFAGNKYVIYFVTSTNLGETIIPWARLSVEQGFGNTSFVGGSALLAANVFVLPLPGPLFTLPTMGGYALQDLPDMDQGEQRLCGFDFSPLLSPGEDVVNATVSLTVIGGSDPTIAQNPIAYFSGSPIFSGSIAQQLVSIPPAGALLGKPPQFPDLRGVTYVFAISARTSFGQAISTWSRLRVRSFYA